MTQEEKAKAYDEALERAKDMLSYKEVRQEDMEYLFPELAESEDERIRKTIIRFFKDNYPNEIEMYDGTVTVGKAIAWLEKQSNTIPDECVFRPVAGCNIESAAKQAIKQQGVLAKKIVLAFNGAYIPVGGKAADIIVNEYNSWLEKQGGIDNCPLECSTNTVITDSKKNQVEPKFHEGEWVILTAGATLQIVKVDMNKRLYWFNDNSYLPIVNEECLYHWTIEDAKDGDVLQLGTVTAIFKKYIGQEKCICYCSIDEDGVFEIPIENGEDNIYGCTNTTPATKEQRDHLFEKMRESGYVWNSKKKELKKINNALEECEIEHIEHGKYYYCIKDYYSGGCKRASKGEVVQALRGMGMMALGVKANEYFIPVKRIVDVSPTWSEDDENVLKDIEEAIINYWHGDTQDILLDWIKSLKERLK